MCQWASSPEWSWYNARPETKSDVQLSDRTDKNEAGVCEADQSGIEKWKNWELFQGGCFLETFNLMVMRE